MAASTHESTHEVVVVVDPYSSGKYLTEELKSQHVDMVAIQSSLDMASFWLAQLEEKDFVECIVHENMEKTLEKLQKYKVKAVTPGSEPGVCLAEDIGLELNLKNCNDARTKEWRRHKYQMQNRLRECNIRACRQIYAKNADEAIAWQAAPSSEGGNNGLWPIIIKPAMSGGTDGVFWCLSPEDVRLAFESECGKVNVNGELNDCLLAQEFLDGIEYIVDCVSNHGKHVLCGIWQYKKVYNAADKSITYEYAEIQPSINPENPYGEDTKQELLINYMFEVLTVLGINYGASHGEVIMCVDGPCLVEVGARMHGLKGPGMTMMATGYGIHELVADVLVNNGRLHTQLLMRNFRYPIKKYAQEAMLNNMNDDVEGILKEDIDPEGKILGLKSCIAFYPSLKKGDHIKKTRDLATAPGAFMLLHSRKEQLIADMAQIREWERTGLYKVYTESELGMIQDSIAEDAGDSGLAASLLGRNSSGSALPSRNGSELVVGSLPLSSRISPKTSSMSLLDAKKAISPYCMSPAGPTDDMMNDQEDPFDGQKHTIDISGLDLLEDERRVSGVVPRASGSSITSEKVNYTNLSASKMESVSSLLSIGSQGEGGRMSGAGA